MFEQLLNICWVKIKFINKTTNYTVICILAVFLLSACSGGIATSTSNDGINNNVDSTPDGTDGTPGDDNGSGDSDGDPSDNQIPVAVADEVITDAYDPISIDILSNDFGLGDLPITVSIPIPGLPGFGNLAIETDNTVTFIPNSGYIGQDSFTYVVTDNNGDSATAAVFLDIRCADCQPTTPPPNQPSQILLTLNWVPNPDNIEGYIVSYGPTVDTVNNTAASLYTNSPEFNASNPSIQFDVTTDLNLFEGDSVCFTIKAFTAVGQSAPSTPACTVI